MQRPRLPAFVKPSAAAVPVSFVDANDYWQQKSRDAAYVVCAL